jgi:outer membrane murein-binding lipoprotein Lpp
MDLLAERVASLEGTLKGVSWALGLLLAALLALVGSGGVFLVFQIEDTKEQVQLSEQRLNGRMDRLDSRMERLDSRIDGLAAKVDALPGQLTAIVNSIANAITADSSR